MRVLIKKMNESTMFPTWLAERMDSEEITGLDFADLQLESSSVENILQAVKAVDTLHRFLILKKKETVKSRNIKKTYVS